MSKMDFATWGPRFKKTEMPDGNWMVSPKLWTRGFVRNDSKNPAQSIPDMDKSDKNNMRSIVMFLQNYVYPVARSVLFIEILLVTACALTPTFSSHSIILSMFLKLHETQTTMSFSTQLFMKMASSRVLAMALMLYPAEKLAEMTIFRKRKSSERSVVTKTLIISGFYLMWSSVLNCLKFGLQFVNNI